MKLLSEYCSDNMSKKAKVFFVAEKNYRVIVNDDFGNVYNATFKNLDDAEDYADDWVLKNE